MYPTVQPGDKVFVNKLIFGARIYKDFNFSDSAKLDYIRVKGIRKIRRNDVIAFNQRNDEDWYRTSFKINAVYLKRCIGLPGDSISVVKGKYLNSNFKDEILVPAIPKRYFIGLDSGLLCTHPYPYNEKFNWTIENFGPLYVPQKGDTVRLDEKNYLLYGKYIEYETSLDMDFTTQGTTLGGKPIDKYVFLTDYYFMAGDNAENSRDSRYFGLVPEDFIIGVATRFAYSEDDNTHKIRFKRIWKKI